MTAADQPAGVPAVAEQTGEFVGRLTGHELQWEGAAHTDAGHRIMTFYGGIGGPGHGKCSCGALSPALPSAYQRRAWHRLHKFHVAAERNPAAPTGAES